MDMYFCPLYSGSSGNSLFCQYGNTKLLIDAGKSGKTIEDALASIGTDINTISGVLITHEHSDHISGAGVLARKYHLPLYATRETWWAMKDKLGKIPQDCMREITAGKDFWLGDIGVVPFSIPHDAADPVGFRLYGGELSVSTATDLGYFSEEVYANVAAPGKPPLFSGAEGADPGGSRTPEQRSLFRGAAAADQCRNRQCDPRTPERGK